MNRRAKGMAKKATKAASGQPVNITNAAQRMAFIPRIVEAARESLKNPPKILTEVAIRQVRGAISFYEQGIYEIALDPAFSTNQDGSAPWMAANNNTFRNNVFLGLGRMVAVQGYSYHSTVPPTGTLTMTVAFGSSEVPATVPLTV